MLITRCLWIVGLLSLCSVAPAQSLDSLLQAAEAASAQYNSWIVAYHAYARVLQAARFEQDKAAEAFALRGLASVEARSNKDKNIALRYLLKEIQLREGLKNPLELAQSYDNLGTFFVEHFQDYAQALGYYQQAHKIRQNAQVAPRVLISSLKHIAQTEQQLDHPQRAKTYLHTALKLCLQHKYWGDATTLCLDIAEILSRKHLYDSALHYALRAKGYYHQADDKPPLNQRFDYYIALLTHLREQANLHQRQRHYWDMLLAGVGLLVLVGGVWRLLGLERRSKAKG